MEGIDVKITISPEVSRDHSLEEIRWAMARQYRERASWALGEVFHQSAQPAGDSAAAIDTAQFDARPERQVTRGMDGHLFIDYDTNQVMAQHAGQVKLGETQLEHWRLLLENRIAWLERLGARYFFLVPPNSHSIHFDQLPPHVETAPERPIHVLMKHLRERSYARLVYPLDDLMRERELGVYPKTSSYWSDLGAFIAYRALIEEMRRDLPLRVLELAEFDQSEEMRTGDLGNKMEPVESSPTVDLALREPRARLVFDNGIRNNGRRVEFEGDERAELSCLVFGDSFTPSLLPFLAESFRRLVFAHLSTLDHALVERERPDVVVTVINERFMIRPPVDVPSRSLRQHEEAKAARTRG